MLTMAVENEHVARLLHEAADYDPGTMRTVIWNPLTDPDPDTADEIEALLFPDSVSQEAVRRLAVLPSLELLQLQSAGFDHVVGNVPPGLAVANGRGVHSDETAEWGVGLTLAALRGLPLYLDRQREHVWKVDVGRDFLAGGTVVVYGAGSIGMMLAARLSTFNVELHLVATSRRETSYGTTLTFADALEVLPRARVVIAIVPLNDSTRGMIDAEFLARLPDGALVVNIARGHVVVTEDLLRECASGRLRAALDVTDPEPLPSDHPLWDTPNVLITPHAAGEQSPFSERIAVGLLARQARALNEGATLENVVL